LSRRDLLLAAAPEEPAGRAGRGHVV